MSEPQTQSNCLCLSDVQALIQTMYGSKDEARGISGTFLWLMEEVGELAAALREEDVGQAHASDELAFEFADVLAWIATIANQAGVDLEDAFQRKYGAGCPGCGHLVCDCAITEKP